MPPVVERDVLEALTQVPDSVAGTDIVKAGMVSGLSVQGGHVTFSIEIDPSTVSARGTELESIRVAAEQAVQKLAGVERVTAVLTAERKPQPAPQAPPG